MGAGPILGSIAVQWYIFVAVSDTLKQLCDALRSEADIPQTRMLVQTEVIITQLVFDHALRIRVKSETSSTPGSSAASSTATTPDNASIADVSERSESPAVEDDETQTAISEGTSASKAGKHKKSQSQSPSEASTAATAVEKPKSDGTPAGNLVGKLNNLVTSDLSNVTNGRDFLFVGKFSVGTCLCS